MSSDCRLRRQFVDTPFEQIHIRRAAAEGADRIPLLLLHQSPASSLTYQEILPLFGARRPSIAIDTPGFGESFRPASAPAIADYARWITAVPDSLGLARFDLMGLFTGAAIAAEMAKQSPHRVRRLILAGPPLFTAHQKAVFLKEAWPTRPQPDGAHLMREWDRVMHRPMPGLSFERRCDAFNEFYRGGANAIWGEISVAEYDLGGTLPQLPHRTLILHPQGISGDGPRAMSLLADARLTPIAHLGYSMLQVIPDIVASEVNAFLDAP